MNRVVALGVPVALAIPRTGFVLANNIARPIGWPIGALAAAAGWKLNGIAFGLTLISPATSIALLIFDLPNKPPHDFDGFSIWVLLGAAVLSATDLTQHATVASLFIAVIALGGAIAWTCVRERSTIAEVTKPARRLRDRWGAPA